MTHTNRFHFTAFLFLILSIIGIAHYARDISAVAVSTVSAASFETVAVAPASIVAAFGTGLATATVVASDADPSQPGIQLPTQLAGTTVEVNGRQAGLFFVSNGQVNLVVPAATEPGVANVVVRSGDGTVSNGTVQVAQVSPSVFSANANGRGVPAAALLRVKPNGQQSFEMVSQFDQAAGRHITKPIDLGPEGERVFMILFLTGIRRAQDANGDGNFNESVRVLIGADPVTPLFAGPQSDFVGLDQVNIELPRTLIGRGIVNLSVNATGFTTSNLVEVEIGGIGGGSPPQINGFGSTAALAGQELLINGGGFYATPAENIVRIAGSDAQVMSATPSQLRVVVPFGVASGTVSVRTPQGEGVSAIGLPIRTSISGFVENTSRQPLTDVTVKVIGTAISARTNIEGAFVLPDVPAGQQFVEVDGGSVGVNPPYPKITLKLAAQASRDNQVARPIAMQQPTGASGTIGTGSAFTGEEAEADAQAQLPITIKTGGFQFDVPVASAVDFPNGAKRGVITMTPLVNGRTPVNLPFGYFSASVVQITPFNIKIALGAKLTFPNSESLLAGTKVELFRYDFAEGTFTREAGTALVSPDSRRIETALGAIKTTSIYFAAVRRTTTTITGRVIEKAGRPVSRAHAWFRSQEATTDGTGTFVLRHVPVTANEPVSVEVYFQRSLARIERVQSASRPAVVNGITKLPDVTLTDEKDNRPPVILAADRLELDEGKTYDVGVIVYDLDLTQNVTVGVGGVSFATLNRVLGGLYLLRLSPNYQSAGERTLTITANDNAGGTSKHEIALEINNVNRPPTAVSQNVAVDQNGTLAITLTGSDPDGDPLRYKLLSQPAHGTLTGTAPNLTYKPNANYTGPDSFTFRTNDGTVDSNTATVSITVRR
ncbi:MAG: Ig-like domain-containing protein [Blastocatellia bacterium]